MSELPNNLNPGSGTQYVPADIAKVASEFTKVFDAILTADTTRNDARDELQGFAEGATNTRLM